jgi:hypothetical protein
MTGLPSGTMTGRPGLLGLLLALAAAGCGGGASTVSTTVRPQPTTTSDVAPSTSSSVAGSTSTVGRPGPPAAGACSASVDAAPAPARTVVLHVASGVTGATFLARMSAPSIGASTKSGTTDATGKASLELDTAALRSGEDVRVEVSVAGGAEACSTSFTAR